MGLFHRPIESSRPAIDGAKARRNLPLEFRFHFELDERRRSCFGACFGPKEIKVAPDRAAAAERDLKRLEARIGHLYSGTILAVLNPCVMHLQLPLGGYVVIGEETFVNQIYAETILTVISGLINIRGNW